MGWPAAVGKLNVPGLHFHDLRHTGNTIAARTGASTRELMARMGHDSAQAAMIYQHATSEADRAIAQAVSDAVKAERKKAKKPAAAASDKGKARRRARGVASGPWMARRPLLAAATPKALAGTLVLTRAFRLERVTGIEPALSAWESLRLPA
ncbi:tyrosine-type recombinase/integrase [Kribbella sp. NPDC003505]|uniref:tyrosine-type recombinase/integrase n=1 Tax=Kribbella sp. NPDC003505 TaxID=3154448 RepID=UPI0033B959A8